MWVAKYFLLLTQCAAVRTRSPAVESTTAALQKRALWPTVENSAPVVGDPLNEVAAGIPWGGGGMYATPTACASCARSSVASDNVAGGCSAFPSTWGGADDAAV